jgi:signal transduction histidine kinase
MSGASPGPSTLPRLSGQGGLAVFSALVLIGFATKVGHSPVQASIGLVIAIGGAIPFYLKPSILLPAYAIAATAGVVVLGNADSRTIMWFSLLVIAAWCVLAGGVKVGIGYWIATVLLFGAEWLWAVRDPGWAPWTGGVTVTVAASLLVRHQFVLVEQLKAAQTELAEQSRAEERRRIAGELHDVIAHTLTVSLLYVTGARLAVEHDPDDAARALAEAERLGRASLTEVRAIMGLLRDDPSGPAGIRPPAPQLDQIPALVDGMRRAGADITVAVDGCVADVPATAGMTAYRIVQEALTNASKHATGRSVDVRVDVTGRAVDVKVESAGPPGHGSGMGVPGMAARAGALGGTCTAGPGGRGWLVRASLPLGNASGSEAS